MGRKRFTVLLLGALSFLVSCVDHKYDIVNKDISTDVKIEGNRIVVPVGSLNAIPLDSMMDVEEIDILEKSADGVYSISMDEEISPVEVEIDPVKLNVDPQEHSVEIDFESVTIDEVHIESTQLEPVEFSAPKISIDDLNDELPVLESEVKTLIQSKEIDDVFDFISKNPSYSATVEIEQTVGTGSQEVECDFSYTLPSEVKAINTINLATIGDAESPYGTYVEVVVTSSEALKNVNKLVDFTITFPENYILYTDKYTLSPAKNEISVQGLKLEGQKNIISFYIKDIINVEEKIENGVLNMDESIVYSLEYTVDGQIELSSKLTPDDLAFNVELDVPLAFKDAKGVLKDIEVEFETINMEFSGSFNNLEYIDTIYYVKFDETMSQLHMWSKMDTEWLKGFSIKDGYQLKIAFPEGIIISEEKSNYNREGVVYNAEEHAFFINDLNVLADAKWDLALDQLNLDAPVIDEHCDLNVEADIYFVNENKDSVGHLMLAGMELESMITTLKRLEGRKQAQFNMESSDLIIEDASVHTEVIKSELETSTDFTINEEIPGDIECIQSLDFVDEVVMTFNMSVKGLDDVNTDVYMDLDVHLPSFLRMAQSPERSSGVEVNFDGDIMHLKANINPHVNHDLEFGIVCERIDFMNEEFNNEGLRPTKNPADGKYYWNYEGEILVEGDVHIDEVEFHSEVLEKLDDIVFDVKVSVNEMEVKTFHGFYGGEIDEVEESFELDLGEDLDFLKEEGNTMTLAEPQIEIQLENTICVPVDVDMQIFGRDDNGNIISSSVINKRISINPAEYDEASGEIKPAQTKLFLTADSTRVSKIGYKNVQVEGLARLLEEKVPNTIDFKMKPVVNKEKTHHVDITKPMMFSGNYAVNIPLKFDNFNLMYTDTIADLSESLGEDIDMLSNVKLNAMMNITNTIPLNLSMNFKALDIDGNEIESITVDELSIKAGLGGKIDGTEQEAQPVVIAIKSDGNELSKLDMLLMSVQASSDHTTGSVGIKAEQGLKISDIVFEILGDIEMDLNEEE